MTQAKAGDTVRIHFTGSLEDGSVFDSSADQAPLEFTIGAKQVIEGFEQAVVGLEPGQKRTVTIPPEQAYGPRYDEMVQVVDRGDFPAELDVEVSMQLQASQPEGESLILTVTEVTETTVTLDANHHLAGKSLTFEIELIEVL